MKDIRIIMLQALFQKVVYLKAGSYYKIFSKGCLFLVLLFCTLPLFSQEYGFMYISNGSSSSTIGTTWTTIGTFSSTVSSTNWSYAGNTLTAANTDAVEGLYLIKYSLSFGADAADWSVGISIAGADPTEPIFNRTIGTGRDGDKGNVSGSILVQISKTNTIELQVKANAAAQSFTPVHAQVVVARVAETSVNYYGGMHISSDQTYANLSDPAGTFVKLTGYAAFDEMSDWTVSNSELTAGTSAAGTYLVVLSASFTGDKSGATPVDCSFDIVKDGTTSINALAVRKTGDSDIGNISAAGIVSISSGSTISIEGAQSTKKLDLIMKKSTVSLYKIVDSTSVSYAGSKITSDQTVTITTQSEWTTVGTFTNDTAYGWSFASNVYTPSLQATSGFYFLDYAASLTTANTSGDDIELGIFIGSYIHPEFTTLRRLADETDIGAVSGNAIFKVDHIDSTITMKVRNTTSTNNLTFKKTYLSNAQIRYVYTENALPITLSNFTAEQNGSGVKLDWQTASEIDNARFLIYRDDEVIASIKGAGTTTEPHYYSF
ncbi:MAG: hypothetical protein U9O95_03745, partial [Candidatus Marinimicrobia bacterium]|nr:hypothetical protein [Candidatus Neomarinimicrobiota bacterium]